MTPPTTRSPWPTPAAAASTPEVSSDLAVTVDDDETVSIVLSKSELTVNEGNTTGQTYTVKLSHAAFRRRDGDGDSGQDRDRPDPERSERDGHPDVHLRPTWSTPQTVTVKADQDADAANDKVTLAHTGRWRRVRRSLVRTGGHGGRRRDRLHSADPDVTLTVNEGDADGQTYTVKLSHEPSEDGDGDRLRLQVGHRRGAYRPELDEHADVHRVPTGNAPAEWSR